MKVIFAGISCSVALCTGMCFKLWQGVRRFYCMLLSTFMRHRGRSRKLDNL